MYANRDANQASYNERPNARRLDVLTLPPDRREVQ